MIKEILTEIIKPSDEILTKDLVKMDEEIYCPPHYLPHALPIFNNPITDEPCHFHKSWRHQHLHHEPFCLTRCPHYTTMKEARRKYFKDKNSE